MVTPRTPRTRTASRTNSLNTEVDDHSKPVEIVVPENTKTIVTERQGTKIFEYEAEVKQVENAEQDQDDMDEFEADLHSPQEPYFKELPKTPIDRLFDDLQSAVDDGNYDSFYAKLVREPDKIPDRFLIPCRDLVEIGVIQVSTADRFEFIPAIQKYNGDSGGRFVISIYDQDHKPLNVYNRSSLTPKPVGGLILIPNPVARKVENNGQQQQQSNGLERIFEMMQRQNEQILRAIERPREKTTLEDAMERKILNDILNPPTANNQPQVDTSAALTSMMANIFAMPVMVEGMSRKMFPPEPPPPLEPDAFDKFSKVASLPVVQNFLERVVDIADGIAGAKFNNQAAAPVQNGQQQQQDDETVVELEADEMMELTTTIITELDGTNPLDGENEVIKNLQAEYPDSFDDLKGMCQAMKFDPLLNLILTRVAKQNGALLANYIDVAATQAENKYVWTKPQGEHLRDRLQGLYEYLATLE